jgi:Arc/MetJ-type ribon-helix-helix transcriptional regulator
MQNINKLKLLLFRESSHSMVLVMENGIQIALDNSHNNLLTLEASSYADFTQFLFTSGYKIGKIELGFNSLENIKSYSAIIISTPKNIELSIKEVEVLEEYVKKGGSLLVIGARGGDYSNRTNLNELTRLFGFEFVDDEVFDSVSYVNMQKRPLISKFKPHFITEQVKKVVLSSSCSLNPIEFLEDEKNVQIVQLINAGINCWRKKYDGKEWVEEDSPKIPLMLAVEYYEGKVVSFGTTSIFSSLGREYGFTAFDNDIILANILRWLTTDIESEGKVITIDIQLDLFHWLDSIVKEKNWNNFSDVINVGLKYFKDNYSQFMHEIEKLKQEREARKIAIAEKKKKEEEEEDLEGEEEILERIPQRKKEDLVDIIDAIEEVTGERYELSIDLEGEDAIQEMLDELPSDLNDFTVKELKSFCKKHEIDLPNNARKADIIKVIEYVLGIEES